MGPNHCSLLGLLLLRFFQLHLFFNTLSVSLWRDLAVIDGIFRLDEPVLNIMAANSGRDALSETLGSCTNNIKQARGLTTTVGRSRSLEKRRVSLEIIGS